MIIIISSIDADKSSISVSLILNRGYLFMEIVEMIEKRLKDKKMAILMMIVT